MLDSINHMTIRKLGNHIFGMKTFKICHHLDIYATLLWLLLYNVTQICKRQVVYQFKCMALYHSQMH